MFRPALDGPLAESDPWPETCPESVHGHLLYPAWRNKRWDGALIVYCEHWRICDLCEATQLVHVTDNS